MAHPGHLSYGGGIHGLCLPIGKYKSRLTDKWLATKNRNVLPVVRVLNIFTTFFIVNFLWALFRANSLNDWLAMLKRLLVPMKGFNAFKLGMSKEDFVFSIILIVMLMLLEYINTKTSLYNLIQNQPLPVRWVVYLAGIFFIILFGVYGTLTANSFIYFQF